MKTREEINRLYDDWIKAERNALRMKELFMDAIVGNTI